MTQTDPSPSDESMGRWSGWVLLLLVLIPIVFNAAALLPELSVPVPSLNDDAFHYLFTQRASEALANGENPFDHWAPELELGFPQFFYYQHLPHLTVVLLHRLLLKRVDLFTLFNLIRYLLLVTFPLTVYWSVRRMGFSSAAGAVAAAAASLLSSNHRYGFEYESYIWRGLGMYTQLWAMHLSFIALASLQQLLDRGKGYVAAVMALSMLALSHLIYAYMMVPTAFVLFLCGLNRANLGLRILRLAVVGVLSLLITSYFWLPFLIFKEYLGASPYLQSWKYDSFGATDILTWLVNGDLLDYNRLPALTVLLAFGVVSALLARTRQAQISLALFILWLALYFGRPTWGALTNLLPMHEGLLFHRFIGGVDVAAILLIGLGGEWLWRQLEAVPEKWRAAVGGLVLLGFMVPALKERSNFYELNRQWMDRTKKALDTDADARAILSGLKELPPGRTYAGLRANWGKDLKFGDVHFYDLLTFHGIAAVSPPYQSLSLNSDLIWHFDDRNPAHYQWFDVKYVVAPRGLAMADFLRPIKETSRYTLYRAETDGYADFASLISYKKFTSQSNLFFQNRDWLLSGDPGAANFFRYDLPAGATVGQKKSACPHDGNIKEERVLPGQIALRAECREPSTVVLKMTYHPNWSVTVDGQEVRPFMVSPSFIGVEAPAGGHLISAEYRSPWYKTLLLFLGGLVLMAVIFFRRGFTRLEALASATDP